MKQKIEIRIALNDYKVIEQVFDEYFIWDESPIYPICINSLYWKDAFSGKKNETGNRYNYNVIDADKNDSSHLYSLLASIKLQPYPNIVLIIFEGFDQELINNSEEYLSEDGVNHVRTFEGDGNLDSEEKNWVKVGDFAREVIKKLQVLEIRVISTDPPDFMPNISISGGLTEIPHLEKSIIINSNDTGLKNTKKQQVDQSDLEGSDILRLRYALPKKKKVFEQWKKAYKLMKKCKEDLDRRRDEIIGNDPPPTDDYYREELVAIFGRKVSLKTIWRIRGAGEKGLLK